MNSNLLLNHLGKGTNPGHSIQDLLGRFGASHDGVELEEEKRNQSNLFVDLCHLDKHSLLGMACGTAKASPRDTLDGAEQSRLGQDARDDDAGSGGHGKCINSLATVGSLHHIPRQAAGGPEAGVIEKAGGRVALSADGDVAAVNSGAAGQHRGEEVSTGRGVSNGLLDHQLNFHRQAAKGSERLGGIGGISGIGSVSSVGSGGSVGGVSGVRDDRGLSRLVSEALEVARGVVVRNSTRIVTNEALQLPVVNNGKEAQDLSNPYGVLKEAALEDDPTVCNRARRASREVDLAVHLLNCGHDVGERARDLANTRHRELHCRSGRTVVISSATKVGSVGRDTRTRSHDVVVEEAGYDES